MRSYLLENVRFCSIVCIVVCHYLIYNGIDVGLGRYMAGVGNILFFLLSSILYGFKWVHNEKKAIEPIFFLKKRIVRIGVVLWPFLFCLLTFFILFDVHVSASQVVANFLFLGAFNKLPGNGHLWFLTVMVMCYIEYIILSKLKLKNISLINLSIVFVLGYIVLEYLLKPGNFFLIMMITAWFFTNTDKIWYWVESINSVYYYIGFLLVNYYAIWMFENGMFESNRILAYPVMDICGVSWFFFLLKVIPSVRISVFSFISKISFEIYVVHHTLCAGPISKVSEWSENKLVQLIILILFSVLIAYFFNLMSKGIMKWTYLKSV